MPYLLFLLEFRFNCFMVVSIGAGGFISEYFCLGNLTNKQHVAAQILRMLNLTREKCICILGNVLNSVKGGVGCLKIGEFIDFPTRLHTEMTNSLKRYILGQNRNIELTCFFNNFTGVVSLLNGNRNSCRVACYLNGCICNATVVLFTLTGKYKQAVG